MIKEHEINITKAFLAPAIATCQLSEESYKEIVQTLTNKSKKADDDEKFISPEEACKILGISKPTLYKLIKEHGIHTGKVGRQNRYIKTDIQEIPKRN